MPLPSLRARLERELRRYPATLSAARDPLLTSFPTPAALRDVLCDRRHAYAAREALVRAVIAEHRLRPHPLWPALLTIAFLPMLAAVRARIGTGAPEEIDQALTVAFLEAIERVALRANLAARLRSATERAIYRALGREQRRQSRTVPLCDDGPQVASRRRTEDAFSVTITQAPRWHAGAAPSPRAEVA